MTMLLVCAATALPASCAQPAPPALVQEAQAGDGGSLRFDGVFYDYRDKDLKHSLTLWAPPGEEPIRGVFVLNGPGLGGDGRNAVRDTTLQEFAARYHFGIVGLCGFSSIFIQQDKAATIVRILAELPKLGSHPELADVPLIPFGGSNAGKTAFNIVRAIPERVICAAPSCGPSEYRPYPEGAALLVPMVCHQGPLDPWYQMGVKDTAEMFRTLRPKGALWSWSLEVDTAHCDSKRPAAVDFHFFDWAIKHRLPETFSPGPVELKPIAENSGWLLDTSTWVLPLPYMAPWSQYNGDRSIADWLPEEGVACLQRALTTFGTPRHLAFPLSIRFEGITTPLIPPGLSGFMHPQPGPIVDAGAKITVNCDVLYTLINPDTYTQHKATRENADWKKITFYDGANALGSVAAGEPTQIDLTVDGAKSEYGIYAIAEDNNGVLHTSKPEGFIVRDPKETQALAAQHALWEEGLARIPAPEKAAETSPLEAGDLLIARGIPAKDEKAFGQNGNAPSKFWSRISEAASLTTDRHLSAGAKMPAKLSVKAAYGADGLYFLMDVVTAQSGTGADRAELHIARLSSADLWKDLRNFQSCDCSLALAATQYFADFGLAGKDPDLGRNTSEGFTLYQRVHSPEESRRLLGILVHNVQMQSGRHAQEWKIPWDYAGNPAKAKQPPQGARFGLVLGFDNTAADSKGPTLRWPSGIDPWGYYPAKGPSAHVWGDLEIGPAL